MCVFGVLYLMCMLEFDSVGFYDSVVEEVGKVFVLIELGGGGMLMVVSVVIVECGVYGFFVYVGVIVKDVVDGNVLCMMMLFDMLDGLCFMMSEYYGLFEMCCDFGIEVDVGDVFVCVYVIDCMGVVLVEYVVWWCGLFVVWYFLGIV